MATVWEAAADFLDPTPDPDFDDPVLWASHNVKGWTGAVFQDEILRLLASEHRVCARGPHGLGKSGMAAIAVLWFADTRERAGIDWKVVCTASAWRQLKQYLWPEIHKWARKMTKRQFGRNELLQLELKLKFGSAFAVASDEPTNIEGAHADQILYILDEAKAIPADTWDAVEGAMSTGTTYALAISTPGSAQGRFFSIQKREPGYEDWRVRAVTLEEAIIAGRIDRKWADQRKLQWGETSPVYVNRVLGEFSTTDQEGIIPLDWIEKAIERWRDLQENGLLEAEKITAVGCDVASTGVDLSIIPIRRGMVISRILEFNKISTMAVTGYVKGILATAPKGTPAVIDVIGVGTGVVDRLREQGCKVDSFNGSEASKAKDSSRELGFINRRAEAWWHMRDILDPSSGSMVALPDDDRLTGDLTSPKWEQSSNGRIKVESKDEIKKRLGRSPDHGDGVVMVFNARRSTPTDILPSGVSKTSTWEKGR